MFRQIFEHIEGIIYLPIFSLLFFFVFFVIVLYIVLTMSKKYVNYMGSLPLDIDNINNKFSSEGE